MAATAWNDAVPSAGMLEGTSVARLMVETARRLHAAVSDQQWPLAWLQIPQVPDISTSLRMIQTARQAIPAAGELRGPIREALVACNGANSGAGSDRLRLLQTEKTRLVDSESQEDLARLAAINRQIKALRNQQWGDVCASIGKLLDLLFDHQLPQELEGLVASLEPSETWRNSLNELDRFCERFGSLAEGVLDGCLSELKDQATQLVAGLTAEQGALAQRREAADQALQEVEYQIDTLEARNGGERVQLQEAEGRWAELWPQACIDLGETVAETPALAAESLQIREQTFNAWRQHHGAEHDRENRFCAILREYSQRLADPEEAGRREMRDLYVRHENITGATCYETGQREFYEDPAFKPYDLVVIEEASKITLPELILAALLGRKVILVGDHRQLPPLFTLQRGTYEEACEEGLVKPEDFERFQELVMSSFFGRLYEAAPEALRHSLIRSYRSHSQIMAAYNPFYDRQLAAAPDEKTLDAKRQHYLQIPDAQGGWLIEPHQHLIFIDSTYDPLGRPVTEEQRGTSKANLLEVRLIVETLRRINPGLQERGYGRCLKFTATRHDHGLDVRAVVLHALGGVPSETVDDLFANERIRVNGRTARADDSVTAGDSVLIDARKGVGVITFYGAQLGEIRRHIDDAVRSRPRDFAALDLRTNTVDRFQGMECPIVLVSLVRAKPHLVGGEYVRQYQRVNVAFSRAQELLIIVGSERTFRNAVVELPPVAGGKPKQIPIYRHVFELARRFGGVRYANQILAGR